MLPSTMVLQHRIMTVVWLPFPLQVNANDDNGVLKGKWQAPYSDGVVPSRWMSSVPILEKWSQTKSGVKYGQCWVFAAVACTG